MRKHSPTMTRQSVGRPSQRAFTGRSEKLDARQWNGPGSVVAAQREGEGRQAGVRETYTPAENRNGPLMDFFASRATGKAERDPVPELLDHARQRGFHPRTLGVTRAATPGSAGRRCRTAE